MPSRYLTIGRITKPQGIRGEVLVSMDTDFPSRFFERNEFLLMTGKNEPEIYPVEYVRPHKDRIVIKFSNIDSRNEAEGLRDMEIVVPKSDRITDDADFFYFDELEGMTIQDETGRILGKVTSIMVVPGRDILVVEDSNREVMIPFAREICVAVDREHRVIHVNMPDGLETLNQKT